MKRSVLDQTRYKSHKVIDFIRQHGKKITYRTHECAVSLGERGDKLFFISRGAFVVQQYEVKTEKFKTIGFHLDDFLPLMAVLTSYFSGNQSDCQLKAVMNSEVFMVKKEALLMAMQQDEKLRMEYMAESEFIILALNEFNSKKITLSSKEHFDYLLTECNEVVRNIPAKYIAEFIGVSAEWLSKIR